MKKIAILLTVAAIAGVASYVVLAAQNEGGMMGQGGGMRGRGMMDSNEMMMRRGMWQDDGMGRYGYGMHPIGGLCNASMIATPEGGAIVMMGNKLMKYDKNLELVKEVEIKIDWENWRKMMMEHRKMMMGQQPSGQEKK
jgi:hypothetical protein